MSPDFEIINMQRKLVLRELKNSDCQKISSAFETQGWDKPLSQYLQYLEYQNSGDRDIIYAELNEKFVGYCTIKWTSDYQPFRAKGIPEIVDFNVLKDYQRSGFGTRIMDEAEQRIKTVSAFAGIGFGLYEDYGAAQILYIKRGYIPDGNGLVKDYTQLKYGQELVLDDSLALYLIKKL